MLNTYKGFETELTRLAKSCCYEYSYPQSKQKECVYGYVEVISCQNESWWYKDLIGMEFLCRLVFYKSNNKNIKYLADTKVVALTNTREIIGRGFDPKDIIIL